MSSGYPRYGHKCSPLLLRVHGRYASVSEINASRHNKWEAAKSSSTEKPRRQRTLEQSPKKEGGYEDFRKLTSAEKGTRDFATDVGSKTRGTFLSEHSSATRANPSGGRFPSTTTTATPSITPLCLSTKSCQTPNGESRFIVERDSTSGQYNGTGIP